MTAIPASNLITHALEFHEEGAKELEAIPDHPLYPQKSATKTIFCQRSGVILGRLDICIFEGHLAYFEAHSESVYLHPFYQMSHVVLVKKLSDALHQAQKEKGWVLTWREQQRVQLLVSAIMHSFGCMKQGQPSLPKFAIAAGSAGRLLGLARWFYFLSSQRMEFPQYSVSKENENMGWDNFKFWLDAAYKIRGDWQKNSRKLDQESKQRIHTQALKEIKDAEVYKRLDMRKIWKWIRIQLEDSYSPGRLTTFESLFLNGDLEIHEWLDDDIDDLKEAIFKCCDSGNTIMHFVRKRLDGMLALSKDFRSGFTLLGGKSSKFHDEGMTDKEALFISEFDQRAAALEEMPPQPQRSGFDSQGLYLKALAQWNILKRRFDQKGKKS